MDESKRKRLKYDDLTGMKFGKLTVESEPIIKCSRVFYLCRCDCGNTKMIRGDCIATGNTRSCGCMLRDGKNKPGYVGENEYSVDGDTVHVKLSNTNEEMLCNLSDWESLKKYRWAKGSAGYAKTTQWENGKCSNYTFHSLVMGKMDMLVVDHINRNRLDNRRVNLRFVTPQVNVLNSRITSNNTSGVKGVSRIASINRWRATIFVDKKEKNLGQFKTKEEAIAARREAEKKYYEPLLKMAGG